MLQISGERTQLPPQMSRTFSVSGHTSTLSYTARCQWEGHSLQPRLCHMTWCRKQLVDESCLHLIDCFQRSMPHELWLWRMSCKRIVAAIFVEYLVLENVLQGCRPCFKSLAVCPQFDMIQIIKILCACPPKFYVLRTQLPPQMVRTFRFLVTGLALVGVEAVSLRSIDVVL